MKAVYCPYCGGRTKRNGRTSSGSQRWRCTACGASTTVRYDDTAARLDELIGWLLSKDSQAAMPGGGRSFRRRTAEFWGVWPMPVPDGELHRVLHVDGIWVARDLVVLICCSGERVVSWYMARSENSRAWSALMPPIPAPEVVVTDGGSGFKVDPRVCMHEPMGFHDYSCLQMNAFAVVSDSSTLPEEFSFFASGVHPFPAVCIHTSTECPEALDKVCFTLAGISERGLLQAVHTAVELDAEGSLLEVFVPDYADETVSTKVVKIIQSYTGVEDKMVWSTREFSALLDSK